MFYVIYIVKNYFAIIQGCSEFALLSRKVIFDIKISIFLEKDLIRFLYIIRMVNAKIYFG